MTTFDNKRRASQERPPYGDTQGEPAFGAKLRQAAGIRRAETDKHLCFSSNRAKRALLRSAAAWAAPSPACFAGVRASSRPGPVCSRVSLACGICGGLSPPMVSPPRIRRASMPGCHAMEMGRNSRDSRGATKFIFANGKHFHLCTDRSSPGLNRPDASSNVRNAVSGPLPLGREVILRASGPRARIFPRYRDRAASPLRSRHRRFRPSAPC